MTTSSVFWITFYRGHHRRVRRHQLHVPWIQRLVRRLLDGRYRLDLRWCCRMFQHRPRSSSSSLELGVLRVMVVRKAALIGVMVMVVMVGVMLLHPDGPQVSVLADELVNPSVQLLYSGALSLDETLLVLDDGGELSQVQNSLHRVFQQAGAHHTHCTRRREKEKEAQARLTDERRAQET